MGDLRYAVRMLVRNPGFAFTVAALLSLGIGANTAIFSALSALLLRPLAVHQPERLIRLVQTVPRLGTFSNFEQPVYDAMKHAGTLSAVFGEAEWLVAMNDPQPAEQVRVHVVTPEFFDVLGVPALYGRTLTNADAREDQGTPPAVLSYGFWQRRFASDPRAVGRTVTLRGHKFLIVGVMPRTFNGITADTAPDLRVPLRAFPLLRSDGAYRGNGIALEILARLKPGVSLPQARAECTALWRAAILSIYKGERAETELSRGMQVESLERGASILRERFGLALQLLAACAGLLLLLMCSNVAGLLVARGAARQEEVAVRLALGATRGRLIRQMLAESGLLAMLGAAGGWLVATVSTPLLVRALPPMRDRATTQLGLTLDVRPDARVLLFAIAASLLTALLFGLAPAVAASRVSVDSVLRGARSSRTGRGRGLLVVFQVALCTLLLSGAGLLVRSFEHLHGMDPGFDRDHVITFTADPGLSGYTNEQSDKLRRALLDRVRALPGVVSAASASRAVMRGSGVKTTVVAEGRKITPADFLNTSLNTISPEYFDTLGMRVLAGRGFQESDLGKQRVVVNQTFAQQFFPNVDPVGRRITGGSDGFTEIIGVVNDAKYRSLREPMTPIFYGLGSDGFFVLCVRTRMRPDSIIQPVRRELAALDPALPILEVHTLAEEVDASAASERLTALLASLFGLLAAVLAAVGIYGLLAYAVAQRRREIGIRMALGARPVDIGEMIGRQSMLLVGVGVAAGLLAAWQTAPAIRSLLYGVSPADGISLGAAAIFVLVVAALATAIPAGRAARVHPATALRDEVR
ncbi:MAG TPA: ABC transporter permease [Candidatus Sulfopaludibacter sp.]|nr:ABC transporter permease [Candidatus Sulfopaludibacter sp.]